MTRPRLGAGLLAAGLLAAGCATKPVAYGPIGEKTPYGYQDRTTSDGGFVVRIVMPGLSPPPELRAFFDRRAAELCPAGVERVNVFRMQKTEYSYTPYVQGGFGVGTRSALGTELEGYVYCKAATPAAREPAGT